MSVIATTKQPRASRGFSLIEALVALVVLSVGLIGLAGLQMGSIQNNHSALLRSQAVIKAYEAMDRMRANRTEALNGTYDRNLGDSVSPQTCYAPCNGTQLAQSDVREWISSVQSLPAGDGAIDVDGGIATVTISWDDTRGAQAPQVFELSTML